MSIISAERSNGALVRRGYEAFNSADMETLTELFDESASWHTPGRSSIAGDQEGREAVFAQFGRYGGETRGTFRATLLHVLESDDGRVVGIHHNSAERNGKHLDVGCRFDPTADSRGMSQPRAQPHPDAPACGNVP